MAGTLWDEPFLRTVAVLQMQRQLLDQQADQLTELADMQAHHRIKSDLAEYVAAHAKFGTIPAKPLGVLQQRLKTLVQFFAKSEELHRTAVASHAHFIADGLPQVSLAEIHQAPTEMRQVAAELPARLQALAAQLSPLDWDDSGNSPMLQPVRRSSCRRGWSRSKSSTVATPSLAKNSTCRGPTPRKAVRGWASGDDGVGALDTPGE